jgi:peroxidase
MGLRAVTSFKEITRNVEVREELEAAYPRGVNTIDAFEGGMAEDHVPGSDVGPLFQAIMVNQFMRLRDGDRFFYLNENVNAEENSIFQQGNTLAKVIKANTNISNLQENVMIFQASISGEVNISGQGGGNAKAPDIEVELQDTGGDVLGTTKIDDRGFYHFDQLSGPAGDPSITPGVSATGFYQVVLNLPAGWKQTSASPSTIEISKGDTDITHVNFEVSPTSAPGRHGWRH